MVLAAGQGRRLAGTTALPKWLLPVNGSSPADAQLRAFAQVAIDRVHVVVPPTAPEIEDHISSRRYPFSVDLIANPHSADRNNWYSLLLGLDAWRSTASEDLVVVNSDLYASPDWFVSVLDAVTRAPQPAALAIDPSKGRTEEAMKVGLANGGRAVTSIGKVGLDQPGGEYVGLAWWRRPAAEDLRTVLSSFERDPARSDDWYEHGIQRHLEAGAVYSAVNVPSRHWVEIDDEHDLAAARALPDG